MALEPGDELGLPWEKWADGRLWRLRKGKHFFRNEWEVKDAAVNAAYRFNKPVQVLVETTSETKASVWVQFSDGVIAEGGPCPLCSGRELGRATPVNAVCKSCGSVLFIYQPKQRRQRSTLPQDEELRRLLEPLLLFPVEKRKK